MTDPLACPGRYGKHRFTLSRESEYEKNKYFFHSRCAWCETILTQVVTVKTDRAGNSRPHAEAFLISNTSVETMPVKIEPADNAAAEALRAPAAD